MKNISWWTAFKVLLRGTNPIIGKYRVIQTGVLFAALFMPFYSGLFYIYHSEVTSGAIPPQTPLISEQGIFVRKKAWQGIREVAHIEFINDKGIPYKLIPNTFVTKEYPDLPDRNPPQQVNVEGFLLQNGKGYFYVLSVKSEKGKVIVDEKQSLKNLDQLKYGYEFIALFIAIPLILWGLSIFFLYQLKQNLSKEA